ncbi:quinolinate synthase NadA [Desulfitispora alkaliphila]|uniref:quinolinate synthase NadA n=1 Tax=Desulfitispora alkaliphila TaxID=622674 RepID=UPI003D258105
MAFLLITERGYDILSTTGDKTHVNHQRRGKHMSGELTELQLIEEIERLKKEKNAILLAHNYQIPEIQKVADIVGDSLKLSQEAAKAEAHMILLSGVHFMAESVKILSPQKKVILPVADAGCPMAEMVDAERLREFKREYPGAPVVCYVNSSAEVKAESHICCTSSNAVSVVKSLDADKVLFVPDKNLGHYVQMQIPEKEIISWEGFCITHHRVKTKAIDTAKKLHPDAPILAHPECAPEVVQRADFVGSTSQIIRRAGEMDSQSFIIGTEMGILHQLEQNNPEKKFYLLSEDLYCLNMKKTNLKSIYNALMKEEKEIFVDEDIRLAALVTLERMLKVQ